MKISIVTVCFNAEKTIEETMQSVFAQTYPNIEYVIVDGNSNDQTREVINTYRDQISIFISEPDQGIYDAMNKGIENASGDALFFLNSGDTFYDQKVLEDVVAFFEDNEEADIIYGDAYVLNQPTYFDNFHLNGFVGQLKSKREHLIHGICHQRIFAKLSVFEVTGGFNLIYSVLADFEWYLKTFNHNLKRLYLKRFVANYEFGGFSEDYKLLRKKERALIIFRNCTLFEFAQYILGGALLKMKLFISIIKQRTTKSY